MIHHSDWLKPRTLLVAARRDATVAADWSDQAEVDIALIFPLVH